MGIFQQFPYSNFHEFNLDQIIKIMREMQDEWEATKTQWASYKDFIDNYFENLDVSEEVLAALRTMAATGELNQIMDPTIAAETAAWLALHITQPTTPVIDTSLTVSGAGADAEVTGLLRYDINNAFSEKISTELVAGYLSNTGTIIADSNDTHTTKNMFPVNSAIPIRFIGQLSTAYNSWCAIGYYDITKTFISRDVFAVDSNRTIVSAILTPPANAYYARLSYRVHADANWSYNYYYIFDDNKYALADDLKPDNFVLGRLASGSIVYTGTPSVSRVSTLNIVKYDVDKIITVDSGYAFAVHIFINGVFDSDSGWITNEYWIPANTEFKLMIRVNPQDDDTVGNIDTFVSKIHVYDKYGNDDMIIRGSFSSGKIVSHASRAVTPHIHKYDHVVKITANSGFQVAIHEYRNGSFFYDYYWRDEWWLPANAEFRLIMQRTDSQPVDLTSHPFTIEEYDVEKMNANIKGVNHRGFYYAPENTIPAFEESIQAGFRMVETDLAFTSDDVPVLLHDTTINRTARNLDYSAISGDVYINNITYAQALDYTFNMGRAWWQEYIPIPTFEEFIKFCKYNSLQPYVELKTDSNLTASRAAAAHAIVEACGMKDKIRWISFNYTLLQMMLALDPEYKVGLLDDPANMSNLNTSNKVLIVNLENTTDADYASYLASGYIVEAYTTGNHPDFTAFNPAVRKLTNNYYHN